MIRIKNGFLRRVTGISLIVIGIIGLIVPIFPGWLFIIAGLVILRINFLKRYFQKISKRKVI